MHGIPGKGHCEVVYKDDLEYEFSINQIPFSREKSYRIKYKDKDIILLGGYNADFVVCDMIILESKAIESLTNSYIKQTLSYLATSTLKLGLLVNFGEECLAHKKIVYK